jgi:hypothetical protein
MYWARNPDLAERVWTEMPHQRESLVYQAWVKACPVRP